MTVDVARLVYAQTEYRSTQVLDASVQTRHPLASQLEYYTLILNEADAISFGNSVLNLRKLDRWNWVTTVNKNNYPNLTIGQTITLAYPRFGLNAGKNFIVKRIAKDSNSLFTQLTLFGPQ